MLVLVTYDVNTEQTNGRRRLRRVAKTCQKFGQRVQNSVFECKVDPSQLLMLKHELLGIMDCSQDSIRIYHLGKDSERKVERFGVRFEVPDENGLFL